MWGHIISLFLFDPVKLIGKVFKPIFSCFWVEHSLSLHTIKVLFKCLRALHIEVSIQQNSALALEIGPLGALAPRYPPIFLNISKKQPRVLDVITVFILKWKNDLSLLFFNFSFLLIWRYCFLANDFALFIWLSIVMYFIWHLCGVPGIVGSQEPLTNTINRLLEWGGQRSVLNVRGRRHLRRWIHRSWVLLETVVAGVWHLRSLLSEVIHLVTVL